jgi:hypothetical protein
MRTDKEIDNEIVALKLALQKPMRWNDAARTAITQAVRVLEKRMTVEEIDAEYYVDETSSEYEDGDNDLYNDMMRVRAWLDVETGYDAPSAML